jgi:hypothetical protein
MSHGKFGTNTNEYKGEFHMTIKKENYTHVKIKSLNKAVIVLFLGIFISMQLTSCMMMHAIPENNDHTEYKIIKDPFAGWLYMIQ